MLSTIEYRILTTDDREEWLSLVEANPQRDVFFSPEYIIPFERLTNEKVFLFFCGNDSAYFIYPFFKRCINDLPFCHTPSPFSDREYFDIVSPYGYSGPLARMTGEHRQNDLWQGFLSAFNHFCQKDNIICEFARLNPFVENHRPLQAFSEGAQVGTQITVLDLTQSEETLWRGFNRGNRSNINKAKRCGVSVKRRANHDDVRRFYELYHSTMSRNDAKDWYHFSPEFFTNGFELLGEKISLFHASYDDRIIAAASFLHDGRVVHYFLGGSESDYFHLRPNNLLMFEAIRWAKREGYQLFNLGGNYGPGKGLARFKAAFSKATMAFYTYRKIHNPVVYKELCDRHTSYLAENNESQAPDPNFFPSYRASI